MAGRKPSVPPGQPTEAERQLIEVALMLHRKNGAWPTSSAIATKQSWSRQRAHALVLRLEGKKLVRRVDGAVEVVQ